MKMVQLHVTMLGNVDFRCKEACDFMCLVLFPHGEVRIFKWKKAINYEKMSFTCENVHSCMEIVTNM